MLRHRLTRWKAVAFRALENKAFATSSIGIKPSSRTITTIATTSSTEFINSTKGSYILKSSIQPSELNRLFSSSANELPVHEIILMPALSPTMTSGNIGAWHKKVGDALQAGDVLCDIETDKAQMDLEVQEDGFLAKILIQEGTKEAAVGRPLAIVVSRKEDVSKFENYNPEHSATTTKTEPASESKAPQEKNAPTSTSSKSEIHPTMTQENGVTERIKASPLARKISKDQGIDLNGIKGTGPHGRIIKSDVQSMESTRTQASTVPSTGKFVDIPLSSMRKVIAARLTDSKQSIPHYYVRMQVRMDRILELRGQFNATAALQETFGTFKLSVNDFIVKAAALALKQVPEVNSAWHGDFIRQYDNVDVSIAVATPSGLITPIVKDADLKGLVGISGEIKELAGRAKNNRLKPEEFQGGTFTISNLGMYGVDSFTAIINPPQSCILAVGATQSKIVPSKDVSDGKVMEVAQVMEVTLSCDHRVVDGATGARWLGHFKRFLEDPEQMIL